MPDALTDTPCEVCGARTTRFAFGYAFRCCPACALVLKRKAPPGVIEAAYRLGGRHAAASLARSIFRE